MSYEMVMCWALNGVAEHTGVKIVTVGAAQYGAMAKIFEGTRYTVRLLDAVDVGEVARALDWAITYTDFSAFSKRELLGAIAFNDRRLMARAHRIGRRRFSSSHDPRTCPQLKSLRLSHAVACDADHFSEEN